MYLLKKWGEFTIKRQHRFKNKGFMQKQNVGLDTETYKGYVKLICDSYRRYKFIETFDDLLQFMTHRAYRNKFCWFFNLKYDFDSIVKYLELEDLQHLYDTKKLTYHTYKIFFIDKKFFSITDRNNHHFYFYDIASFVETSLNNAAKKYLKEEKMEGVDGNKLNTDLQYWKDNTDKIVEYCLRDCYLTKEIADYFWNIMYKSLGFNPKNPYSKGHFSEEYFLSKCYIPTINEIPMDVLRYAFMAYSGGRFEILKRGYFDNIYCYDIKSAYPSEIANLIDYNAGKWQYTKKYDENAYDGFYYCKILSHEKIISPFMQKINQLNVYPVGNFYQYLSHSEIEFILKNFKKSEIEIIDGWEFYEIRELYPFKQEIERLYHLKETESDADIKYAYKIILNSLYGKTIQTAGGKSGKIFNPIWAANITGKTRLKLLKLSMHHFNDVISFSTDSVHSKTRLDWKQTHDSKLGDFDIDFIGKGFYIMSDIYELWNENKIKERFRGFTLNFDRDSVRDKNKHISLRHILESIGESTEYSYTVRRPLHLGEILTGNYIQSLGKNLTKEDLNIFFEMPKTINLNGDLKRVWEKDFTSGKQVMETNISSKPILIMQD